MQITKCDKCKKEIENRRHVLKLFSLYFAPNKTSLEVELCKECAQPYLNQLSQDELVKDDYYKKQELVSCFL